jgi:protein-tyrosine phosphatase
VVAVLFVCMGNICRSPTAEGVFRALVAGRGLGGRIAADSAGTHAWHVGDPPDPRTCAAARRRGLDLSGLRARQATADDFRRFDYVLAMDRRNQAALEALRRPGSPARLGLFLDFAPRLGRREMPDPYYGGPDGFELVLDLAAEAAAGLLNHIVRTDL